MSGAETTSSARIAACLLAFAAAAAGEPPWAWDWLPPAAYAGEPVVCALRPADDPGGWRADPPSAAVLAVVDGAVRIFFATDPPPQRLTLAHATSGQRIGIAAIAPGQPAELRRDADGRLRAGDDLAILLAPRAESARDRRWLLLAAPADDLAPQPSLRIRGGDLLDLIIAARRSPVQGSPVLIEIPAGRDGWQVQTWRQTLGWLLGDLARRGATRIALVEPVVPAPALTQIAQRLHQLHELAAIYRCTVIRTQALSALDAWLADDGTLGDTMNAAGRAAYERLLAAWLPVADR